MGNVASSNARPDRHNEPQGEHEPHETGMTRRRGRAARGDKQWWESPYAEDTTATAHGRLSSAPYQDDSDDFCEISASAFKAAKPRGKGRADRQPTTKATPAARPFSFNDQAQPNPWGRQAAPPREPDRQREREPERTRESYTNRSAREQFNDISVSSLCAAQWMTGV